MYFSKPESNNPENIVDDEDEERNKVDYNIAEDGEQLDNSDSLKDLESLDELDEKLKEDYEEKFYSRMSTRQSTKLR